MKPKHYFGLFLLVLSFAFLIPGITQPMISINAFFEFMGFKKDLLKESRSILQTIQTLWEHKNATVAFLIFFFSIAIPVLKTLLLLWATFSKNATLQHRLWNVVSGMAKWSMADVFVVGIFVAYLSAKATDNMDAKIENGFYYFTGYCLLSIASTIFLKPKAS